jgi:hypothetical protein
MSKYIKINQYEFINELSISLPHKDWDNLSTEEKTEILFGKQTNLEKQFSKLMVNKITDENDDIVLAWSTFNVIIIELEKIDEILVKEAEYRISDGENPVKVLLSIIDKVNKPSNELIRLKHKISDWVLEPY